MEMTNIEAMFDGIQDTLFEAASCSDGALIGNMQSYLDSARAAFDLEDYLTTIGNLEEIALAADVTIDGFDVCNSLNLGTNYRGNFVARGLSAAFTAHDRFLHPDVFVLYEFPDQFDRLKPDLREF